jgi:hypothetical protein
MGGLRPASPAIWLLNRLTRFGYQPDLYLAFIEISPGDLRDLCLKYSRMKARPPSIGTGQVFCQQKCMKKALGALKALQGRIGLVCQTSYQLPDATTYTTTR